MEKQSNIKRVRRENKELVIKLLHHLTLLLDYSHKAFYDYEHETYIGEVAGKLRVLVINTGQNKALLLKLMDEFEYEFKFFTPPRPNKMTLDEYIQGFAGFSRDKYEFTNEKLIKYIAQQTGASHEDWTISNELHHLLKEEMQLMGGPTVMFMLRPIANTVLMVATSFLIHLHRKKILKHMNINYTLEQIITLGTRFPQQTNLSPIRRIEFNINPKPINNELELYKKLELEGRLDDLGFNDKFL